MADINLSNGISKYADLVTFASEVTANWNKRNEQMKGWYKLIQQTDELAQTGMESFVGNDPRSSFNLILHMLDTKVPHRIPNEFVDQTLMVPAGEVERLLRVAWSDVHKAHRKTGRQTWMRTFLSFILSTGWYAVFAQVVPDGTRCMAEIWNPATVYPDWDSVMWRCVHRYDMKKGAEIGRAHV